MQCRPKYLGIVGIGGCRLDELRAVAFDLLVRRALLDLADGGEVVPLEVPARVAPRGHGVESRPLACHVVGVVLEKVVYQQFVDLGLITADQLTSSMQVRKSEAGMGVCG